MSEEEYLALPEEKPYLEYVDGVVLQKAITNAIHRDLIQLLTHLIYVYQQKAGGRGGPEGRVRLPDGSGYRLPDTAYWAPDRFAGDDSVPSVVIEVRSRDQGMAALRRKCRAFRANGVDVCWLIDPYARIVEIFEGDRDGEALAPDGALVTSVMPGFSVSLSELFTVIDR